MSTQPNCGQKWFHASGDAYYDATINAQYFEYAARYYNLASDVYNSEHINKTNIGADLLRSAQVTTAVREAVSAVDEAVLPWEIFNGVFAGAGGPFAVTSKVPEKEPPAIEPVSTSGGKGRGNDVNVGFNTANLQSKLEGYLLNAAHPQNQAKANWFQQALGFDKSNWQALAAQIRFDEAKATATKTSQYGHTYEQIIPITGTNGKIIGVPFVFMKDNSGVVRLVTGIPAKK